MTAEIILRCAGKTILQGAVEELVSGSGLSMRMKDLAPNIYELFHRECRAVRYLDALLATAQLGEKEAAAYAKQVVQQLRQDPALAKRMDVPAAAERLFAYLEQIPTTLRNHFMRPSDPKGLSVPPDFRISNPLEMIALLPSKAPKFRYGDNPVGDWRLNRLLGMGAHAEVWQALSPDNRPVNVALKFCLTEESVRFLRHEKALLQRMVGQLGVVKGIVKLRRAWLEADPPCLEYEYVNGGDLCGLMAEWQALDSEKKTRLSLRVIKRLAKILAPLHAMQPPLVHRDLKPANVLVVRGAKGKFNLKISDFGIGGLATESVAKRPDDLSTPGGLLTKTLRGTCSALYAGPEQKGGAIPHQADDIHALGVIGYQLLVGDLSRAPASDWEEELEELQVPEGAIGILRKCLARQANRYPDGKALYKALDAMAALVDTSGDVDSSHDLDFSKSGDVEENSEDCSDEASIQIPGKSGRSSLATIQPPELPKTFPSAAEAGASDYGSTAQLDAQADSASVRKARISGLFDLPKPIKEKTDQGRLGKKVALLGMGLTLLVTGLGLGLVVPAFWSPDGISGQNPGGDLKDNALLVRTLKEVERLNQQLEQSLKALQAKEAENQDLRKKMAERENQQPVPAQQPEALGPLMERLKKIQGEKDQALNTLDALRKAQVEKAKPGVLEELLSGPAADADTFTTIQKLPGMMRQRFEDCLDSNKRVRDRDYSPQEFATKAETLCNLQGRYLFPSLWKDQGIEPDQVPMIYSKAKTPKYIDDLYSLPRNQVSNREKLVRMGKEAVTADTKNNLFWEQAVLEQRAVWKLKVTVMEDMLEHEKPLRDQLAANRAQMTPQEVTAVEGVLQTLDAFGDLREKIRQIDPPEKKAKP
jgi:serine/threonine protein kinase